ncbi:MAG: TrkH family potassium uptake protein [Rhodospirillales bacterium]|nr:TrkH family potassium uptake protein [Rhodospirillales bacterium]
MHDYRPIFLVVGMLLATLAAGMLIPAAVDAYAGNPDWQVFAVSAGVTMFVGVAMALSSRAGSTRLSLRQAFLLTTVSWIMLTLFAAIPLAFSDLGLSYTDAFFEAMSGLTTTGSTVITGLDQAPPGILMWRALLQWLGGVGIIVMAIAVMPMLRVGGMQLFRMESSDPSEKALPRGTQIAAAISVIYLVLTAAWAGAYWLGGMSGFEAVVHSMTTIATGGFSTSDGSFAHFDSAVLDVIATVGMVVGGLPFLLYLKTVQGDMTALGRDSQVQWFITVVVAAIVLVAGWLWLDSGFEPLSALRYASFNVVSVITGTGYASAEYDTWGAFAVPIFFFIMFIGGCAGSTTSGIKIFRFQVIYATTKAQIERLMQPHGVFTPYYNRKPIPPDVSESVMGFFFLFALAFTVLALGLSFLGLDFLTSMSGAASAIANVGPGMGEVIGPAGTFATLPDSAKWLLSCGMLIGRLELYTVLILFAPSFWRG